MRIAICDDDVRFCRRLKDILEKYEETYRFYLELEVFSDGSYLCERMAAGRRFDLIFLDIVMEKVDGVETGRFIRKVLGDYDTKIVYVSSGGEPAIELFQNLPMDFLRKPVSEKRVWHALNEGRRLSHKDGHLFSYKRGREIFQIPYSEIMYYQSVGHRIQIHTPGQMIEYIGKLSELLDQGLPPEFIIIHKSFVVNRNYITRRTYSRVYIKAADIWLSVSQIHRKPVRRIMDWYDVEKCDESETNFVDKIDEF